MGRHRGKLGLEVILLLLIRLTTCENSSNGNSFVSSISQTQTDACLLQNITLKCTLPSAEVTDDIEWTVYPLNMTITATVTSSDTANNCSISEALYDVSQIEWDLLQHEGAVYFLVTANSTPVCNISLSLNRLLNSIDPFTKVEILEEQRLPHNNVSRFQNVMMKELSTSSANTQQIIGECVTEITYGNCSILQAVNFTWYLNDSRLDYDIQNSSIYDYQEDSGILNIRNDKTSANYIGLYLCVTTFPGGIGSYVTAVTNLVLMQTSTTGSAYDSLPSWAIAVIVVISVIAVGILVVVGLVFLQLKVGWVSFFYPGFANDKRMSHSKSYYSEGKSEYFKSQTSKDQLIKTSIKRSPSKLSRPSSQKHKASQIKDKWEIEYNCIVFEEIMHEGTFKNIHQAVIGTHSVAVKKLRDEESELGLNELKHEVSIHKHVARISNYFEHPNVLSLYGVCTVNPNVPYCLILETMENGTLDNLLRSLQSGPLPAWYIAYLKQSAIPGQSYVELVSADLIEIIQQIVSAMIFLNRHGIIHRDLSTRNVFIGENLLVKVGNFGMTHEGRYYIITERGHYIQDMAPECILEEKYSVKSDVWSFGCVLYKICSLERDPYPGIAPMDILKTLEKGVRPKMPPSCSEELFFLMQRCWKYIPMDRPTFTTLQKCFVDYKYSPSNYVTFQVIDADNQTDYGDDDSGIHIFCPPKEVIKHFNRMSQAGVRKSTNIDPWDQEDDGPWHQGDEDPWGDDPWNQDLTLSTMNSSEMHESSTIYSSDDSHSKEDEVINDHVVVQIEDVPQPARDRRQKRLLTTPALLPNDLVTNSVEMRQQPPSHDKSRRVKSWNVNEEKHSSRLFVADHTDPFLAPAYKELMIPSQSESSLDNNDDSSAQKHQYRYAYP